MTRLESTMALAKRLPRFPERSFPVVLAFLAFVVARYIQLGARKDFLAAIRFELILGVAVIALVSYELSNRKPNIGQSRPMVIAIGAMLLAMVVHVPFAASPILAKAVFNDRVIKFLFLTYFMAVMIESPKVLKWFLTAFLFSVFYITLESVEGLISGGLVWQNQGIMRLHGAVPIYMHPNSLSGMAMSSIPYVAFLFPHVKSKLLKLGLLATVGTSLICIVYSGSRTGYVGLIAFVLWWWFQSKNKWKFVIYAICVGIAALFVIPEQYIERFKSISGQETASNSKSARLTIMRDAVDIFIDNPLGVGVSSFPIVRMQRFGRLQDTHNLYLQVATNLGFQGLIVFAILVIITLQLQRRAAFSFRANRSRLQFLMRDGRIPKPIRARMYRLFKEQGYLIAVCQATAGFIVVRLVLGFFGMDLYEVYWWFAAGLSIVMCGMAETSRKNVLAFYQVTAALNDATPEENQATQGMESTDSNVPST